MLWKFCCGIFVAENWSGNFDLHTLLWQLCCGYPTLDPSIPLPSILHFPIASHLLHAIHVLSRAHLRHAS